MTALTRVREPDKTKACCEMSMLWNEIPKQWTTVGL